MPNEATAQVQDAPEVTTTPTDSPTETKVETETEPSQGGETTQNTPVVNDVPFHKHPRWIERERKFNEMEKELGELRPLRDEFGRFKSQIAPQELEMPDWWKEAFGTDEVSKAAFKKQTEYEAKRFEEFENRILERFEQRSVEKIQKEQAEVQKWETYIETEVQNLREKGYQFDRNELLKVVEDYSKDAQGNFTGHLIPFERAYEILQLKKAAPTPTVVARQTAAAQSVAGTNSATTPSTLPTLTEVRERGWGGWRTQQ